MKKLSMVVIFLLLATSVFAHEGSVGLYTTQAATDCDAFVPPATPIDIYIMYYRSDGGPDGISGVEFMIEKSSASTNFLAPTWNPATIQNGSIETGIGRCVHSAMFRIWPEPYMDWDDPGNGFQRSARLDTQGRRRPEV